MLNADFFSVFNSGRDAGLSALFLYMFEEQKNNWDLFAHNLASLDRLKQRSIDCGSYIVSLQCNPDRIRSTGAAVDPRSVIKRPCFLCSDNRPPRQTGILYNNAYILLCNPYPIFPHHGTIVNVSHVPQLVVPYLADFFCLVRDLAPDFSIFYNGPACGASAPDHMHFQCSPAGMIPVENDSWNPRFLRYMGSFRGVSVSVMKDYGRSVCILDAADAEALTHVCKTLLHLLSTTESSHPSGETPVNCICSFKNGSWHLIIFPRSKHRPDSYYHDDERQILVSPASVDMGGLIVTPREADFTGLTAPMINDIFLEVSSSEDEVIHAVSSLLASPADFSDFPLPEDQ